MKHCFQAVNGECAAFFTPLHLKWWQPVDCDSTVCFSVRRSYQISRMSLEICPQNPICLFILVSRPAGIVSPACVTLLRAACKAHIALCVTFFAVVRSRGVCEFVKSLVPF